MKFFKSFRLLHRRTKSDSDAVLFPPVCTTIQPIRSFQPTRYRNSTSDIGRQRLTHALPQDPFQLYVFPEEPNTAHISLESLLALEADLQKCKAAYVASVAQIEDLKQQMADKDERIKELELITHAVKYETAEITPDTQAITGGFVFPQPSSSRTNAQYSAAIDLTIRTRAALRENKKFKKFWKRKAQEDGKHADTITPSASDISSIHDGLTPDRQEALDALRARRSQMSALSQQPLSSIVEQEHAFPEPTATHCDVKPESDAAPVIPSISLVAHAALSPLASQSFHREVSRQTSGSKILAFASRDQKINIKHGAVGTGHPDRPPMSNAPPSRKYIRNTYHNSAKVIRAPSSRSSSGTSVASIFSTASATSSATIETAATSYSATEKGRQRASSGSVDNNHGVMLRSFEDSMDKLETLAWSSKDHTLGSSTCFANTSGSSYVHVESPVIKAMPNATSDSSVSARSTSPVTPVKASKMVDEALPFKSQLPITVAGVKVHRRQASLTKHIGSVIETIAGKPKGSPKKNGSVSVGVKTTVSVAQRVKSLQGASPEKKILRPFR